VTLGGTTAIGACAQSHYATIVEAQKDTEIYQHGNDDCPACLRRMVSKHEQVAQVFRDKIAVLVGGET
jgi:hypothetical protein